MHTARIAAALFVIVAACGTSATTDDAGTDAGGVCCPITGEPLPCGCAHGGGWAPSVDQCPTGGICDGEHVSKDDHGCDMLVSDLSFCCLCAPDSGKKDAIADAPTDVTSE